MGPEVDPQASEKIGQLVKGPIPHLSKKKSLETYFESHKG